MNAPLNPKSETRIPKRFRNPNSQNANRSDRSFGSSVFLTSRLRVCFGFRASDFGFPRLLRGSTATSHS
jgi:hypothetical protein